MAKPEDKPAKPVADALSLDAIESIEPSALPQAARSIQDPADKAFAEAIIAAAHDGNAARGPEIADRKVASATAAKIKRIMGAFYRHAGVVADDRPTVKTQIVPKGSGYAWVIRLIAAVADTASVVILTTDGAEAASE